MIRLFCVLKWRSLAFVWFWNERAKETTEKSILPKRNKQERKKSGQDAIAPIFGLVDQGPSRSPRMLTGNKQLVTAISFMLTPWQTNEWKRSRDAIFKTITFPGTFCLASNRSYLQCNIADIFWSRSHSEAQSLISPSAFSSEWIILMRITQSGCRRSLWTDDAYVTGGTRQPDVVNTGPGTVDGSKARTRYGHSKWQAL